MCKFIRHINDVMCLFNEQVSPYRPASEIKCQAFRFHKFSDTIRVNASLLDSGGKRVFPLHFYNKCWYLGQLGVAETHCTNCLLSRRTLWDEPLYGAICHSTADDIQAAFPKCSVPHQAGWFSKAAYPLRRRQRQGRDTDRRWENVRLPPNMQPFNTMEEGWSQGVADKKVSLYYLHS